MAKHYYTTKLIEILTIMYVPGATVVFNTTLIVVAETCEMSTNIPRRFISRTTRYTNMEQYT